MEAIFENQGFEKAGKTFVDVRLAEDWQYEARVKRIRINDVVKYYAGDARNLTRGCRSLAGINGDWRFINCIANDCLEYFKHANIEGMRKAGQLCWPRNEILRRV